MNTLQYKGYTGLVEYDAESGTLHGEVLDLRDVITFQSTSADTVDAEFRRSVNEYLAFCAEKRRDPEKPFSGKLALRMSPELHRQVHVRASAEGLSLNQWIVDALSEQV